MLKKEKILVLADSHGNFTKIENIIKKEDCITGIIHCGDGVNDLIHVTLPDGVFVISVEGNIDHGRVFGYERILDIELFDSKILITHGDMFGVKNGIDKLRTEAKDRSVDVVFFGHTHIPFMDKKGGAVFFNPGSVSDGFYGIVEYNGLMKFYHKRIGS